MRLGLLLLPLLAACAKKLPAPEAASPADYSGLAPFGSGCVAVSDAKDPAAPRVYLVDGGVPRAVGGTDALPVDLEAVAVVGDELLVASGSGRSLALLRIVDGRATDLRAVTFDVQPADQIEGLAVLRGGQIVVGTRGGDVRGTVAVYTLDRAAATMARLAGPVDVHQPCGLGGARDISELAVAPGGTLWAVAAVDPGDEGPFASCAYLLALAGDTVSTGPDRPFAGDKVEALAWCGGRPTAGTDNEALPERLFEWTP